jgi:predicted RNA polymerase sigma factor
MFLCCHPALALDAQVALTLRLLGGLETPELARAFLVPEATSWCAWACPPRRSACSPSWC